MIKRMSILTRRADVTPAGFREHWLGLHARLVPQLLPETRGYVQNVWLGAGSGGPRLRPPGPHRIDGIVQLWFDGETAMDAAFGSPRGAELFADGRLFIDTVTTFVVEPLIMQAGPRGPVKHMSAFARRADIDEAEFRRLWHEEHPDYVRRGLPRATGYVQNRVVDAQHRHVLATGGEVVHGFVEIWWASEADMLSDLAGPAAAGMKQHADRFIASVSGSRIEENVVIALGG